MLSYLDPIIFPDTCDVLEVSPGRYVYPIYKNGSSSLYSSNFKTVQDISSIETIDVFIRDPYTRFFSGVNTYLNNLGTDIDRQTALHFVQQYLFLNRHYCPQFHWLVNLRRHTESKIRLLPFADINTITKKNSNKSHVDPSLKSYFNSKLDFYLQLDKVLSEDLIGKVVSFEQIVSTLKERYPEVYEEIVQRSINICSVLDCTTS